jgi:hypothetical protein
VADHQIDPPRRVQQAKHILKKLGALEHIKVHGHDRILSELNDHINDCNYSLESHFFAASKLEKWQNIYIKYSLLVSSGFLVFVNIGYLDKALTAINWVSGKDLLSAMFAGIIFILSSFNAVSNLQQRAEKHRNTANKYIVIKRNSRQLKVEVDQCRDQNLLGTTLLEKLNTIKTTLNNIAEDAPQIPEWAHKHTISKLGAEDAKLTKPMS